MYRSGPTGMRKTSIGTLLPAALRRVRHPHRDGGLPCRFPGTRDHRRHCGGRFVQPPLENRAAALEKGLVIGIVVHITVSNRHAIGLENSRNESRALKQRIEREIERSANRRDPLRRQLQLLHVSLEEQRFEASVDAALPGALAVRIDHGMMRNMSVADIVSQPRRIEEDVEATERSPAR